MISDFSEFAESRGPEGRIALLAEAVEIVQSNSRPEFGWLMIDLVGDPAWRCSTEASDALLLALRLYCAAASEPR